MDERIQQLLTDRVNAGVQWADENLPGWRIVLNLEEFDIGYGDQCVLGQWWLHVYPEFPMNTTYTNREDAYFVARRVLSGAFNYSEEIDWAIEHGFTADGDQYVSADLNAAWEKKFRELGMLAEDTELSTE